MSCYEGFARVYDAFMADIPYTAWAEYIEGELRKYLPGIRNPLTADLACGTGCLTVLLAQKGFDMIGVDKSADMLNEAREKVSKDNLPILFLAQDVRRLDLFGTIDAAVSTCDGLNYLLSEAELFAAFSRVSLFLNPGGIFIFDMNTEYKFREVLKDHTFTDTQGSDSFLWKNDYDAGTRINEYRIFFITDSGPFDETHYQRAYPTETVKTLLGDAGLTLLHANDAYTYDPPKQDSVRISYIARKKGNTGDGSVCFGNAK
jgi:SAM-dependent methyltransferase